MIPLETMTDEQFQEHALRVLGRGLGPYGLARYIRLNHARSGDYTRDRHKWQDGLTIEDVLGESKDLYPNSVIEREAS